MINKETRPSPPDVQQLGKEIGRYLRRTSPGPIAIDNSLATIPQRLSLERFLKQMNPEIPLLPAGDMPGVLPRIDHNTTIMFATEPCNEDLVTGIKNLAEMQHFPVVTEPRYRVIEEIDSGGQANVWKALDLNTGEPRAVKRLKPSLANDGLQKAIFYREAVQHYLRHENIVPILDYFQYDKNYYYVMPFIHFPTVDQHLRKGSLQLYDAINIFRGAISAFTYTAAIGVYPRDIKPNNMFYDSSTGEFRVSDIGVANIANLVQKEVEDVFMGTPIYMSNGDIDSRKNWSEQKKLVDRLGIVLYGLLSRGRTMYRGNTLQEVYATQEKRTNGQSSDHIRISILQEGLQSYGVKFAPVPDDQILTQYLKTSLNGFTPFHQLIRVWFMATHPIGEQGYQNTYELYNGLRRAWENTEFTAPQQKGQPLFLNDHSNLQDIVDTPTRLIETKIHAI